MRLSLTTSRCWDCGIWEKINRKQTEAEIRSNVFRADEVFYDVKARNKKILGEESV